MNKKFTPGPWVEDGSMFPKVIKIHTQQYDLIADVPKGPKAEANARLIAAAPEMFELLQAAKSAIYTGDGKNLDLEDKIESLLAKITTP